MPTASHDPLEIDDAVEALRYWRERRAQLPWHRRAARREAERMIESWERRLRPAVLRTPGLPLGQRLEAGLLVLRTRLGTNARLWRRRAWQAAVAVGAVAVAGFALLSGLLF